MPQMRAVSIDELQRRAKANGARLTVGGTTFNDAMEREGKAQARPERGEGASIGRMAGVLADLSEALWRVAKVDDELAVERERAEDDRQALAQAREELATQGEKLAARVEAQASEAAREVEHRLAEAREEIERRAAERLVAVENEAAAAAARIADEQRAIASRIEAVRAVAEAPTPRPPPVRWTMKVERSPETGRMASMIVESADGARKYRIKPRRDEFGRTESLNCTPINPEGA